MRAVSTCQPCPNKTGALSVYAQHQNYLQGKNDDTNPRTAFIRDLKELQQWIEMGDQIIIGGDVNDHVFHQSITEAFEEHLVNVIFDKHDSADAPKTYLHSQEGRIIDGVWATPGIEVTRCGHQEPGQAQSNHSLLWLDVTFESALGHNPPLPQTPDARRLKLSNSKVTKKYLDVHEKEIHKNNLPARQFKLEASTTYGTPLIDHQKDEAEAIDYLRTKCMLKAERKCRKLKMGAVQFSPAIAQATAEIAFWDIAIKRKFPREETETQRERRLSSANPRRRKNISAKLWRRAKKAANITKPTKNMTKEEMMHERREAKKRYKDA